MEDRAYEAEQWRRVRLARQDSASDGHARAGQIDLVGWLRQLATRLAGAGA
jgi:hypothetical protein